MRAIAHVGKMNQGVLCIGCGACVSVCPVDAVVLELRGGQLYPKVDKEKCTECRRCVQVCPGLSVFLERISRQLWPENRYVDGLGRIRKTGTGFSLDEGIRFSSASGGMSTALLMGVLERGLVQGAVVTRARQDDPTRAESLLVRTKEEVLSAQTSKYCPSSPAAVLRELKNTGENERFAFVGLPCHIHALRKFQQMEPWALEKVPLALGLFCGHGVTSFGMGAVLNRFGKGCGGIERFEHRGRGWPGGVHVRYKDGEEFDVPHKEYWTSLFSPYFFTPCRCLTCCDVTAELADISVGDAWLKEVEEKDTLGTSVVVIRSEFGEEAVDLLGRDRKISFKPAPESDVIRSQRGILARKRSGVGSRMRIMKVLFRACPEYDRSHGVSAKCLAGGIVTLFNVFLSKMGLGRRLIERLPGGLLARYAGCIFHLTEK